MWQLWWREQTPVWATEQGLWLLPLQLWAEGKTWILGLSYQSWTQLLGLRCGSIVLWFYTISVFVVLHKSVFSCTQSSQEFPRSITEEQRCAPVPEQWLGTEPQGHCSGGERQEHADSPSGTQRSWCWPCSAFQQPKPFQQARKCRHELPELCCKFIITEHGPTQVVSHSPRGVESWTSDV